MKFQLKRATVQNHKTGALEVANYRISKSAWLGEREHSTVAAIRQRVSDITSLTVETAEELQVVNYGIGGHYEPHFDFARVGNVTYFLNTTNYDPRVNEYFFAQADEENAFKSLGTGNRIATVLFYVCTPATFCDLFFNDDFVIFYRCFCDDFQFSAFIDE